MKIKIGILVALAAGLLAVSPCSARAGSPPPVLTPSSDVSQNRVKATGSPASHPLKDHLRTLPDVSWDSVAIGSATVTAADSTTSRALKDRWADVVNVKDYGAKGDGSTDDTAAFQAAANSGKRVVCGTGATYRVGSSTITASTPAQVFDFTGCKIKLLDNATAKGILRLNGAWQRVVGGEWDLNPATNADDGNWRVWAVMSSADHQTLEGMYVHDSTALCLNARTVNHLTARGNRLENCQAMGLYADAGTASVTDLAVVDNYVIFATTTASQGIGIYSIPPYVATRLTVSRNTVLGPIAGSDGTTVGITVRGAESVIANNIVRGTTIAISDDQSSNQKCSITGNNVAGMNGGTAYGIEINGGYCTVSGNYVDGGSYGITGSAPATGSLDHLVLSANVLANQTVRPIYFLASAGRTGWYMNITGNSVRSTSANQGIYLQGDFKYGAITGNILRGPGSSTSGSRGIYLDSVNSDLAILGNKFSGWERAVAAYNNTATAYTDVTFSGNDLTNDMGGNASSLWLNAEGTATFGTGVKLTGNNSGNANTVLDDLWDRQNRVGMRVDAGAPEGVITLGSGSLYVNTQNGSVYMKPTPTGTSGYKQVQAVGLTTDYMMKATELCSGYFSSTQVCDVVNRANSSTSAGAPTVGNAWVEYAGTIGVSSKTLYNAGAPSVSRAAITTTAADAHIAVQFASVGAGPDEGWLIFRYVNSTSFWRFGSTGGGGHIYQLQYFNGSTNTVTTTSTTYAAGDWVECDTSGASITCYVNGVQVASTSNSFSQAGTIHGIQTTGSATFFGFMVW